MVTMWNPADEVQNFTFRLVFSGGHYDRLITLQPRATYMFSISEIMASPGPDLDGNLIPAGTHEGSAEIVGVEADNQSILVAEDAAIYNVRKATCGGSCQNCDGGSSWSVPISPFGVSIGGYEQENLVSQWCDGNQYNLTGDAVWTTSNGSLATVQTGNVHGVAVGQVTIGASDPSGPICAPQCNPYGSCPAYYGGGGQSQGTVGQFVTFTSFSSVQVGSTVPVQVSFTAGAPVSTENPVVLTIDTMAGSGAATFAGGSTTQTLTSPTTTTVNITGVTASDSSGNMYLDATQGSKSVATDPQTFTVTKPQAYPNNLQMTQVTDEGNGYLHMVFTYGSTSGNLGDLSSCQVREYVTYSTQGNLPCPSPLQYQQCYWPPSPPWPNPSGAGTEYPNPTSPTPGPATAGQFVDNNLAANLSFVKPYSTNSFPATQIFQYSCSGGAWTQFGSTYTITRAVKQVNSQWVYQISKTGTAITSTYILP